MPPVPLLAAPFRFILPPSAWSSSWVPAAPAQHGDSIPQGLYLLYNDAKNDWGNVVKLIAAHDKGKINGWILWQEVTIARGQWCTWHGSEADYAHAAGEGSSVGSTVR
jgi:hypothetical protein